MSSSAEVEKGVVTAEVEAPRGNRSRFAFACAILASMTSIILGYDSGVMSGAAIFIKEDLKLSDVQLEILMGILNIYSLVGSGAAGRTSDWIGRRYTIVLAGAFFFCAGIGVGYAMMIAPVYTADVAPATSRGFLSSFPEIFINIGILLGYVSNYFFAKLPGHLGWRFMLGVGAIPLVCLAIGVLSMPESPRWLVLQGRLGDAFKVLDKTSNTKEEAISRLNDIKRAAGIPEDMTDDVIVVPNRKSAGKGVWKDLLVRPTPAQSPKRTRATCTSSTPPPQAQQQTSATYPWPREQEGEPIDLDSPLLLDFNCEGWDKGTAARYNALLRVDMFPTRFCHVETLADLGINEDVFETLHAIGIAPLCYTTHELYPDLARQVLATATIMYEDSNAPSYANCSFSFMADGEYYSLSLDKLNEIYETATEPKGEAVAKKNPALWVIAKIISNLLFAKDLTSKVTNGELQTLYAGIEDEIRASGSDIPIQKVKTNPGFSFMTMICERRQCLMHGSNKKDRSGSLLTPLFKHFGIDLGKYNINKEVQLLDIKYLMACHIMCDEETYSFFDKAGTQLFTKLPHPEITRFSVFDTIRFLPPPELLCTDPRAAVPDADMEDVEDITPEAEPSYDLGELADVTDDQAYRCWMVDSQRKNNSLMQRILHLITGGCIGGSNHRQPPAEQTPRSH
ncbi:hypothetical protein YC2023_081988 [Brassica napus]